MKKYLLKIANAIFSHYGVSRETVLETKIDKIGVKVDKIETEISEAKQAEIDRSDRLLMRIKEINAKLRLPHRYQPIDKSKAEFIAMKGKAKGLLSKVKKGAWPYNELPSVDSSELVLRDTALYPQIDLSEYNVVGLAANLVTDPLVIRKK